MSVSYVKRLVSEVEETVKSVEALCGQVEDEATRHARALEREERGIETDITKIEGKQRLGDDKMIDNLADALEDIESIIKQIDKVNFGLRNSRSYNSNRSLTNGILRIQESLKTASNIADESVRRIVAAFDRCLLYEKKISDIKEELLKAKTKVKIEMDDKLKDVNEKERICDNEVQEMRRARDKQEDKRDASIIGTVGAGVGLVLLGAVTGGVGAVVGAAAMAGAVGGTVIAITQSDLNDANRSLETIRDLARRFTDQRRKVEASYSKILETIGQHESRLSVLKTRTKQKETHVAGLSSKSKESLEVFRMTFSKSELLEAGSNGIIFMEPLVNVIQDMVNYLQSNKAMQVLKRIRPALTASLSSKMKSIMNRLPDTDSTFDDLI